LSNAHNPSMAIMSSCSAQSSIKFAIIAFSIFSVTSFVFFVESSMIGITSPATCHDYNTPEWSRGKLTNTPIHGRLSLANLPTPIHKCPVNIGYSKKVNTLFIKRDDMTAGVELGGNKIRKLEFLLADALQKRHDCVVTIGGEQSNHCRATATAARMVGLEPHLILRVRRDKVEDNVKLGYTGNLLFDRMVGAMIHTCTPGEYGRFGSHALLETVCCKLRSKGKNPYPIPVGGSNAIGSWGYIEAVNELKEQLEVAQQDIDHIVFACGSGGTAAGITIGVALAFANSSVSLPRVHAVGVCDDPDYFYEEIYDIGRDMGLFVDIDKSDALEQVKDWVTVYQGKGKGYAVSTAEELTFCRQFSVDTGVVLDPVYSGKALYHFLTHVVGNNGDKFKEGSNFLFWHTGGSLGLYDKGDDMLDDLLTGSPLCRMDLYGKQK